MNVVDLEGAIGSMDAPASVQAMAGGEQEVLIQEDLRAHPVTSRSTTFPFLHIERGAIDDLVVTAKLNYQLRLSWFLAVVMAGLLLVNDFFLDGGAEHVGRPIPAFTQFSVVLSLIAFLGAVNRMFRTMKQMSHASRLIA